MNESEASEKELDRLLVASQGFIARGLSNDEALKEGGQLIKEARQAIYGQSAEGEMGKVFSKALHSLNSSEEPRSLFSLATKLGVDVPDDSDFPMMANVFFDRFTGFVARGTANRTKARNICEGNSTLSALGLHVIPENGELEPVIDTPLSWEVVFWHLHESASEDDLSKYKMRIASRRAEAKEKADDQRREGKAKKEAMGEKKKELADLESTSKAVDRENGS